MIRTLLLLVIFINLAGCSVLDVARYEFTTSKTKFSNYQLVERSWKRAGDPIHLNNGDLRDLGFYSALVLKNDAVLFELYKSGRGPDSTSNVKSVSKSIFSAVVGIAEHQCIVSLDKEILSVNGCEVPKAMSRLTALNLLNMDAGLRYIENQSMDIYIKKDWYCEILNLPVEVANGQRFNYATPQRYLLGAYMQQQLNTPLKQYFDEVLFTPLDIYLKGWRYSPESLPFNGTDMVLTTHDLLAFAQLYINQGKYKGTQVIPGDWINQSFETVWPEAQGQYGYGLHWWQTTISNHKFLVAMGYGGQSIFINRENQLIVVTTAPLNRHDERMIYLRDFIAEVLEQI